MFCFRPIYLMDDSDVYMELTGSCRLKLMSNVSLLQNHKDYMTLDNPPPHDVFHLPPHRGIPQMHHAVFQTIGFPAHRMPLFTLHTLCVLISCSPSHHDPSGGAPTIDLKQLVPFTQ